MNLDLEKPNFIFSSDIQSKANFLARRYRRKLRLAQDDGDNENRVDIATSSTSFTLNVELNTLLLRNRMLRASDLVKENLISIANDSRKLSKRCLGRPLKSSGTYVHRVVPTPGSDSSDTPLTSASTADPERSPISPPSASGFGLSLAIFNLSTKNDEIFIVSLNLKVLDLIVNKGVGGEYTVSLDFFKDESYGILVLCDFGFVDQIEHYVKLKLVHEIATLPDSREISDESDDEEINTSVFNIDISIDEDRNTSIDTHSLSSTANEEEFLKNDSPEKEPTSPSGVQSGDITRLNTQEEEVDGESEDQYIADEEVEIDLMYAQGVLLNNKPVLIKEDDEFLTELDNLRHNEHSPGINNNDDEEVLAIDHLNLESESILAEDIAEVDCDLDDISSPKRSPETSSRVKTGISKFDLPSYLPALQPPIEILRKPTPPDGYVLPPSNPPSLPPPPSKMHSQVFISPRRGRELSKKSLTGTFSTIHDEDTASELEYAFRDRSPTVPSYIKQNKKFKFIKVGKVQKFVHLFEEKKPEPSGDLAHSLRHTLRQPLRSGSPQRVSSD